MQAWRPELAQGVAAAAAPGCAFISRWLALFFVPNLVLFPLVLQMTALDAMRLLWLLVVGLAASLPLAALTASAALSDTTTAGSTPSGDGSVATPSPPPAAAAAAPPKPWRPLLLTPTLTGVTAVLSHHLVGGFVSTFVTNAHLLTSTVCGFVGGQQLVPKRTQKVLHPLITCTIATLASVAAFALATAQPIATALRGYLVVGGLPYSAPGNLLLFMLGPATLSFGFQMFSRRALMAQSARAVSLVVAVSSTFGLFATALAARLLNLAVPVRLAAVSRQVTAPLAIAIAGMLSADPSLAATIVVITGLLAANFGRATLDALGVTSPVARGLAMGAAGHGLGTAAMAEETEAFPFAAIAMALNAAASTVLVSIPAVRKLLLAAAGA